MCNKKFLCIIKKIDANFHKYIIMLACIISIVFIILASVLDYSANILDCLEIIKRVLSVAVISLICGIVSYIPEGASLIE